jgi:hypothetical protein
MSSYKKQVFSHRITAEGENKESQSLPAQSTKSPARRLGSQVKSL